MLEIAKRVNLKWSHHKKEMVTIDMVEVLANAVVVITLQFCYSGIKSTWCTPSKSTILHVNYISIKLGKNPVYIYVCMYIEKILEGCIMNFFSLAIYYKVLI